MQRIDQRDDARVVVWRNHILNEIPGFGDRFIRFIVERIVWQRHPLSFDVDRIGMQ